jgi:hypothetical protein
MFCVRTRKSSKPTAGFMIPIVFTFLVFVLVWLPLVTVMIIYADGYQKKTPIILPTSRQTPINITDFQDVWLHAYPWQRGRAEDWSCCAGNVVHNVAQWYTRIFQFTLAQTLQLLLLNYVRKCLCATLTKSNWTSKCVDCDIRNRICNFVWLFVKNT